MVAVLVRKMDQSFLNGEPYSKSIPCEEPTNAKTLSIWTQFGRYGLVKSRAKVFLQCYDFTIVICVHIVIFDD